MCMWKKGPPGLKKWKCPFEWLDLCGHWRRGYWSLCWKTRRKSWRNQRCVTLLATPLNWFWPIWIHATGEKKSWRMWCLWHWSIIIVLLYINFSDFLRSAINYGNMPLCQVGSIWLMYLSGFNFCRCGGCSALLRWLGPRWKSASLMLVYLNQAWPETQRKCAERAFHRCVTRFITRLLHGAGYAVRLWWWPAAAIIIGLLPILVNGNWNGVWRWWVESPAAYGRRYGERGRADVIGGCSGVFLNGKNPSLKQTS